ncbi:uncharacterized protein LOC132700003 [Cylas formicarius]|uniref:uncharacterized protein LOC132700003 n=1 Tax=Cylas formicarius TaxID=197179 RepID=UPI0029588F71|nr:uncharacterized protein LOC132700003 [Cylas formicarius]
MATLKDLCLILQQCTEKIGEETKTALNDLTNLITSQTMTEVKLSLEKAKDYHYKEIMSSLEEILKHVRLVLFHEEKIRWLSDEHHFTQDELKRYSYVQRQVNAFSKSKSEEAIFTNVKREKRRVASEVSIGTLEAWEKYLDCRAGEEQKVEEVKKPVPKRTNSDSRRRKKFVSSTVEAFLENNQRRYDLDSIVEDVDERLCSVDLQVQDESDLEVALTGRGEVDDDKVASGNVGNGRELNRSEDNHAVNNVKPRIVDVIYKRMPS